MGMVDILQLVIIPAQQFATSWFPFQIVFADHHIKRLNKRT